MPHPAYISMATIHLNGYIESGRWGHRRRHVWRRGMMCSLDGDVGLKWLQLSLWVTGGSGSEASAVNNDPDVHRWLLIRPVWVSGIRFDSFSSQPSKRAACTVQGHAGRCRGACVRTWRMSEFIRNQRVTNDYVSAGWCNSLKWRLGKSGFLCIHSKEMVWNDFWCCRHSYTAMNFPKSYFWKYKLRSVISNEKQLPINVCLLKPFIEDRH